jgi:hypothetical protein
MDLRLGSDAARRSLFFRGREGRGGGRERPLSEEGGQEGGVGAEGKIKPKTARRHFYFK